MQGHLVKSYAISKGWKAFLVVVGVLMFPLALFCALDPLVLDPMPNTPARTWLLVGLGIGLFFLGIYLLVSTFKSRFEVWSDRIRDVGVFGAREIALEDLAGYRTADTQGGTIITFFSNSGGKSIRTSPVFDDQSGFSKWIDENVTNLDKVEAERVMEEAKKDEALGT